MNGIRKKELRFIGFAAIMRDPISEVDWLVEPLIGKGDRAMLYGEWGSFKSWLLMDVGLHLAAGIPWLNRFKIPSSQSVLYVDEEMSDPMFRLRLQMLARGAGVHEQDLPFQLLSQPGITFDHQGASTLLTAMAEKRFAPDVIIVETFRRVMAGDENEASEVAAFWRNVAPLLQEGRTLLLSHHMRKPNIKGNDSVRDRASGSTDIMAGLDSSVAVHLEKKHAKTVTLHHVKCRWGEEIQPFTIHLDGDQEGKVVKWVDVTTQNIPAKELGNRQAAVKALETWLAWNPKSIVTTKEVMQVFTDEGMKERTAERLFQEYRVEHGWQALKRGTYQIPSPLQKLQDQVA